MSKIIPIIPLEPVIPACWDKKEDWAAWNQLNKKVGLVREDKLANYCTDCTEEYKQKMLQANRCAHPETEFVLVRGTNIKVGYRK